jgi:hypothetical protein
MVRSRTKIFRAMYTFGYDCPKNKVKQPNREHDGRKNGDSKYDPDNSGIYFEINSAGDSPDHYVSD